MAAANPEVQERGLLKHARIARAIDTALRERDADELTARLTAEVGMLAFSIALERWIAPDNDKPFAAYAAAALAELETRLQALQLAVGDVEKIAAAAGRIEHAEV